jgi:hypothetical protein
MRNDGRGPDQDYWPTLIEVEAIAPRCTSIKRRRRIYIARRRRRTTTSNPASIRIELKHIQPKSLFPLYSIAYTPGV